jgi:hypothetical protein
MGGKSAAEYKGVAKFFTFLSDTDRQVELHTKSGYLPITRAAYDKTKASGFYKEFPYLETPLLELTNKEPTENSRGLRLGNMVQLRDVWAEEIEAALAWEKIGQSSAGRGRRAQQHHAAPIRTHRRALTKPGGGGQFPRPCVWPAQGVLARALARRRPQGVAAPAPPGASNARPVRGGLGARREG